MEYLVTPTSTNCKLGSVPVISVGSTVEGCQKTCQSVECPLLPKSRGGPAGSGKTSCYSFNGTGLLSFISRVKSAMKNPARYGIDMLKYCRADARIVRLADIGDPAMLSKEAWLEIKQAADELELQIITYTHGWRKANGQKLKGHAMASVHSPEEADDAIDQGWQAAVQLPSTWRKEDVRFVTPKGRKGIICPAMVTKAIGRYRIEWSRGHERKIPAIQCNTCRICNGKGKVVIGFPDHSMSGHGSDWR